MPTVETLIRDVQHGARKLVRDWRFTAAAILILSVGIGANTAIFSLVGATLLRRQPFASDRLVDIYQNGINRGGIDANSYPAYQDIAAYTDVFVSTTAAFVPRGVTYQHDGMLRTAVAEHTTAEYLSVLGLRPSLGRWFTAEEDRRGAELVAVVGHQTWTTKFSRNPSLIGRTIRIEGVPVTIVGVGPAGHNGTINVGIVTDFWLPIASLPAFGIPVRALERRPSEAPFFVKGRLREGVSVAQAQAAMRILGARLAAEYPKEDPGRGFTVVSTSDVRVHPQMDGVLRAVAFVLLGLVGLVLAIACSNLATLLLVRGAARAKEMSIRLALGATRRQLVRQLLIESVLLSLAGGMAGCLLAWWTVRWLGMLELPIALDLTLDYRVLVFAVVISLVTGVASGLMPALQASRVNLVPVLRSDREIRSERQRRVGLKNAFVTFQVAVSVVLLGVTTIFLQLLTASRAQDPGFAIDGIAMLQTDPRYAGDSALDVAAVMEEIRRRAAAIPGVESVVVTRDVPMQVTGFPVVVEGATGAPAQVAGAIWAGPGYFDTLRIPLLYGRAIDERDRRDTPRVAVISETMARQYFGSVNAVGRRFRLESDMNAWFEVIGVARDTGTAAPEDDLVDPTPQLFYRSFTQSDLPPNTVLARTSLDAVGLVGAMQREVAAVNATLPVISAKTMARQLEDSLLAPKAAATLLSGLSVLGLCLAGVGLYAIVAFNVLQRAHEIGVRMALGARSAEVVWTVVREVAVVLGIGTIAGLMVASLVILAFRAFSAPAPGIDLFRPTIDPTALLAIAALMVVVGLTAASIPTWRATRIVPLKALRRD